MSAYLEPSQLPPLMTITQAVQTGAACGGQIRKMCRDKTLKAVKVGSDWRINRDFFLRYFGLSE